MTLWAATPRRNTPDIPDAWQPSEDGLAKAHSILAPRENHRMKHGHSDLIVSGIDHSRVSRDFTTLVLHVVTEAKRPITAKEVGEITGRSKENAATALKSLFNEGTLTRQRGPKNRDPFFYEVAA